MKTPFLSCTFALALCSMASATEAPDTISLSAHQAQQPIGIEPQGGVFHAVLDAKEETGTYTLPGSARSQGNGTIALYATGTGLHAELPLARFTITGQAKGEAVRLTLTRSKANLIVTAADAAHPKRALTVTKLSKTESLQASIPPSKTAKLPGIAEGPGASSGLKTTFGLRSADGTLRPFLHAGDPAGSSVTLNLPPTVPGQTTADFSIYAGDNQYLENDRRVARYLVSGLSANGKARFAITFTTNAKGELEIPAITDSVTKQPLTVHRYSDYQAEKMQPAQP